MKKQSSTRSGGKGSSVGTPKLNKHLQTPMRNAARTVHVADDRTMYGGVLDHARSLTKSK